VSILNRLRLSAHLDDAALAAIWTDGSTGGVRLPHPHLDACAACRTRYVELSGWLEDVRVAAISEADAAFPAERLAAQHAAVFRRLEAAERPARVIAFPRFAQPLTSRTSHLSRWVTAAAAAGLIVGVGLGNLLDLRHSITPSASTADLRGTQTASTQFARDVRMQPASVGRDEAFLSELDKSLSRAAVPELQAIDAFTPRAGDQSR
jgi:hypothetical protein